MDEPKLIIDHLEDLLALVKSTKAYDANKTLKILTRLNQLDMLLREWRIQ